MSISILQDTNNAINIQDTYSLFSTVINNFLKLLRPENNSYKHTDYYITYFNDLLKEDNISITKCVIFIIMTIYHESLTNRFRTNYKNSRSFEKDIINDAVRILENDINLQYIIKKINNILSSINLENYYDKYEEFFGCELLINYDNITEINNDNIKNIYENFHKIKRLVTLFKLNVYCNEEINEIDDYLFCLFYYSD
jgi:hypothetical protein